MTEQRAVPAGVDRWVLAGIEELRHRPPAAARAPAGRLSDVIALALPLRAGIHLPAAMQVAFSVVTTAREFGRDTLLVTADEGPAGLARVAGPAVDGLIVMDVEMDDPRAPALRALQRPSVLIGHPGDTTGLTCVDLVSGRPAPTACSTSPGSGTAPSACSAPPARSTTGAPASPSGSWPA